MGKLLFMSGHSTLINRLFWKKNENMVKKHWFWKTSELKKAKDIDGHQCYLYVGIVDLLQEYDLAHKWQYCWKAVKHGISKLPFVSVQPPQKYKGKKGYRFYFRRHSILSTCHESGKYFEKNTILPCERIETLYALNLIFSNFQIRFSFGIEIPKLPNPGKWDTIH